MNPKQKLEQAAEAYLEAQSISIPVYKGIENDHETDVEAQPQVREVPCATVAMEGDLVEAIPNTGNWEGDLIVSVEADGLNMKDADFDTLCREVFQHFSWNDLATKLTDAYDDFTCLYARAFGTTGRLTQGNNWVNGVRIHVVFCESDL